MMPIVVSTDRIRLLARLCNAADNASAMPTAKAPRGRRTIGVAVDGRRSTDRVAGFGAAGARAGSGDDTAAGAGSGKDAATGSGSGAGSGNDAATGSGSGAGSGASAAGTGSGAAAGSGNGEGMAGSGSGEGGGEGGGPEGVMAGTLAWTVRRDQRDRVVVTNVPRGAASGCGAWGRVEVSLTA
jgi:hypothetical protein